LFIPIPKLLEIDTVEIKTCARRGEGIPGAERYHTCARRGKTKLA